MHCLRRLLPSRRQLGLHLLHLLLQRNRRLLCRRRQLLLRGAQLLTCVLCLLLRRGSLLLRGCTLPVGFSQLLERIFYLLLRRLQVALHLRELLARSLEPLLLRGQLPLYRLHLRLRRSKLLMARRRLLARTRQLLLHLAHARRRAARRGQLLAQPRYRGCVLVATRCHRRGLCLGRGAPCLGSKRTLLGGAQLGGPHPARALRLDPGGLDLTRQSARVALCLSRARHGRLMLSVHSVTLADGGSPPGNRGVALGEGGVAGRAHLGRVLARGIALCERSVALRSGGRRGSVGGVGR